MLILIPQSLKAFGIIQCCIQIVDRARANHDQKTLVFTVQDFFNTSAGGRNMFRNRGGNGMPLSQFSRCDQLSMRAVRSSSVLFMICLRKFLLHRQTTGK